jgi:hypothetical protein
MCTPSRTTNTPNDLGLDLLGLLPLELHLVPRVLPQPPLQGLHLQGPLAGRLLQLLLVRRQTPLTRLNLGKSNETAPAPYVNHNESSQPEGV